MLSLSKILACPCIYSQSPSPPIHHPSQSLSSAAGSSASSSLSNVHPQARTLSSALGVHGQQHQFGAYTQKPLSAQPIPLQLEQQVTNRTMSVEMADVSGLSLQNNGGRHGSGDEERMREKARDAQEQASRVRPLALISRRRKLKRTLITRLNRPA